MTRVIGGNIPAREHRKLKTEDAVEYIIDRLVFAKFERTKNVRRDCLFYPSEMGPMWISDPAGEGDDIMFNDPNAVNSPDLVWPLGVGMASVKYGDPEWGTHIQCNYWQSIDAKLLRGWVRQVGRKNIGWYHGKLKSNGEWVSVREFAAWHFGKWRRAQPIKHNSSIINAASEPTGGAPIEVYSAFGEDDIGTMGALGQSVALTYRYEWGAQFSIDGSPRVIIPVTPSGVKELFNDREKPVDRDRRAALRHWVRQHRRKKGVGDFSAVRRHLRGELSFQWRGFDVKICPSAFDQDQNKKKGDV